MTFRKGHTPKKEIVNIVFNCSGLGDQIARMSAIRYLRDNCPWVQVNLITPDYFYELACNLVPGIEIHKFSEGPKVAYLGESILKTSECRFNTLSSHLVSNAFAVICNQEVGIEHQNYCKTNLEGIDISKFNLPKKYIVITCGFTSKTREMLPNVVNELSSYVLSKGYTPVFLGKKEAPLGLEGRNNLIGNFKEEIDLSLGIDLIDRTNLIEAAVVIAGAKTIIACDNGLVHLAATTEVPIVVSFTNVRKETRLPIRNNQIGWNCYPIEPDESLECRFCQSNWILKKQKFTECFYVENKLDTKIRCVENITSNKYIKELEKIL